MNGRVGLGLLATALLIAGLIFGFGGVKSGYDDCGRVFKPVYGTGGFTETDQGCRDAISNRKPFAFGALGLAGLAVIGAFLAPVSKP